MLRLPIDGLQCELQRKDRRRMLRRQTALQVTSGAMKIAIGMRQMLFGSVMVLRQARCCRRCADNRYGMMMRGNHIERVQQQPQQQRSNKPQPVRIGIDELALVFHWRSQNNNSYCTNAKLQLSILYYECAAARVTALCKKGRFY